jgi:hypothetical protein
VEQSPVNLSATPRPTALSRGARGARSGGGRFYAARARAVDGIIGHDAMAASLQIATLLFGFARGRHSVWLMGRGDDR